MNTSLPPNTPSVFHAYDVRGVYPTELNPETAYRVAYSYFQIVPGEKFVIGYDMRTSCPELFSAIAQAANELGKQLDSLGMVTTDMLYFAVGKFGYDGGIMLTASHNPRQYAGIKLTTRNAEPINMTLLEQKYHELNITYSAKPITVNDINLAPAYAEHVLSFIDSSKVNNLHIVIDAGNGLGGLNARPVFEHIPQVKVTEMYFEPNDRFPHHEANPAIPANTSELAEKVIALRADVGVAFDGDGDRCFLVDHKGQYVAGHHLIALIAKIMLQREPGAKVVHDCRNIMALQYELNRSGGVPVEVMSGHTYYKQAMHEYNAVFGAEPSGHYYFRNNFYADNGLIPVLLVLEYLSINKLTLAEAIDTYREEFYASPEINFDLEPGANPQAIFEKLKQKYHNGKLRDLDGVIIEFAGWRINARMSNTEPKMRVNIEANSSLQVDKITTEVYELLSEYIIEQGESFDHPASMTAEQKFEHLIHNLWFTWNPHYILPFIDLYGDGWRRNPHPGNFSSQYGKKKFEEVLSNREWEIDQDIRLLNDYEHRSETWFHKFCAQQSNKMYEQLHEHPIAYFCMEYGLVDWLQIYSGGLGILAGDFLKQASDMGVPMVGIGIFYHQGFFHQDFNAEGYQVETYLAQNPSEYPVELVRDAEGNPLEISIEIIDHEVWVRAWRLKVGSVDLLLLDTNFERNDRWEDRMISAHLYGGDNDTRIRQEILLGIGGSRMLDTMQIVPAVYHMNEGHSGFLVLELARRYIETQGLGFAEAMKLVDDQLIFTNHTLKQAGNDIFNYQQISQFFNTYLDNLHTDINTVFAIGKDDQYAQGNFSMTLLGMRNARKTNAVSKLHGVAAKKLWPDYNLIPVTNGVHMPTWVSPEMHMLLDKYVGENWHEPAYEVDYQKVLSIPDQEIWAAHLQRKEKLITAINNELNLEFDPNALTIAWGRRFAAYKRPDLIMQDVNRLAQIVNHTDKPVQIILTGKAHPQDALGKKLMQQMWQSLNQPQFKNKVVLIPGYNWQLARRMVSGADVWLNSPYRYEEASGTSGMKAAANGVLQFTTLDGWTDEVNWEGIGWVISEQDTAHSFYDTLEQQITPLFFNHAPSEFNPDWTMRMKRSMLTVLYQYSTARMLEEYLKQLYLH